jgi:hypothetical protein
LFAGGFDQVMKSRIYRQQFEEVFLSSIPRMNAHSLYVGLGPTPHAARRLATCVDAALIRQDEFLGSFPHPSTSVGDQVPFFLREDERKHHAGQSTSVALGLLTKRIGDSKDR